MLETILFVGAHYEVTNPGTGQTVTKYYFAGSARIAMRKYVIPESITLTYLFGDHLGSTSLAVDASTGAVIETRYKPWGEVRYATPDKTLPTLYTFTGQFSYVSDEATDLGSAGFGLLFFKARFYDPVLGRFSSADSIVPGGVQGYDRYAFVNNNPIRYIDPSGHLTCTDDGYCPGSSNSTYWSRVFKQIQADYEVTFVGSWSFENKIGAVQGVLKMGTKLSKDTGLASGAEAFRKAYVPTKLNWVEGACGEQTDRCYAEAEHFPNTINFYSSHWTRSQDENGNEFGEPYVARNPAVTPFLAVHELGHAFDVETGRGFNQATADQGINNRIGFGKHVGGAGPTEIAADLFANYVMGTFSGPSANGTNLGDFMQTHIATWVDAASAYTWPR